MTTSHLQRLLTWLSPAFPVGAFAWSAGLETAIADRRVTDAPSLKNWLEGALAHGGLRTDAIVLAHAYRADAAELADLAELYLALTPAGERRAEALATGEAFAAAARAWPSDVFDNLPSPCPYPIAVGAIAAASGIPLADTLLGFLTAAVHGQTSVAVRLVPLGQTAGLTVVAALEPEVAALAHFAGSAALADLGTIAYAADIAQMRHELLEPRISGHEDLMDIAAQLIAAALGIVLLAIAISHLLWSVGILWPIRDERLLARTVAGFPSIERMPPKYKSFIVAVLVFAACVIAFSVADPVSGGLPLTLVAFLAGLVFLARGIVGFTAWWAKKTPEQPFRSLDRKTYSPLCLIIGIGFIALATMRLL